jgi:hypothetical protein
MNTMVDGDQFFERVVSVREQYRFALRALQSFQNTKETVEQFAKEELDSLHGLLRTALQRAGGGVEEHWAFTKEGIDKYLDGVRNDLPRRVRETENRLRQNELILLMAIAEEQLKEIHREILRQNPSLLDPQRQIPLGALITEGQNEIMQIEIERAVQTLDRKSIEQRAKHFQDHLGIDWFGGTIVPIWKAAAERRNAVLHEDVNAIVTEGNILSAMIAAVALPMYCCLQAAVLYPKGFKMSHSEVFQETVRAADAKRRDKKTEQQA